MTVYKNQLYKVGHGYNKRPKNRTLSIIVHSTNGKKGSSFESEYLYLLNSKLVSAHYLIGKDGRIEQMLTDEYTAWHVGTVYDQKWSNSNSIGIEVHYTPGENKYIPQAIAALTDVVKSYLKSNSLLEVEMHRRVAAPKGRKIDPSFFSDSDFDIWRDITLKTIKPFEIAKGTHVYTAPDSNAPKAHHITNEYIEQGIIKENVIVDAKRENVHWLWLSDGVGFVESRFAR